MSIFAFSGRLLSIVGLLTVAVPVVLGQSAQVSGQVSDPNGSVLPGVEITVTNTDNGAERKLVTNGDGNYVAPSLQLGNYRVSAVKQGFKPTVREGLTLEVGDNVKLDFKLAVGNVSEQVTVTAETPLLRTDDAETGEVIDNRRIEELPQYNRNVLAFASLSAGVNGTADQQGTAQNGFGADFRINGGRTTQSEYTLDGISLTEGYDRNVAGSVPTAEAVQEFKVITNGLSAEYGRLSGGEVELVTRSGNNQFHGSAYEFVKNQLFNANGWVADNLGEPKAPFHNNIFGVSFGGPIWIPKIYNGHNKTFFFLNYEGNRYSGGSNTVLGSVPSAAERTGDFSASVTDAGVPVTIYDPTTGVVQPNGSIIRQPFPGNKIPQNRIDPIAAIYNTYYPLPNRTPDAGTTDTNDYVGSSVNISKSDRWTGRMDQVWSSRQSTYFTITTNDNLNASPGWMGPLSVGTNEAQHTKSAALHHLITLNPTTILEVYAGGVRDTGPGAGSLGVTGYNSVSSSIDSSKFGFAGDVNQIMGVTVGNAPVLEIFGNGGYTSGQTEISALGGGGGSLTYETDFHGGVSLQKLVGKHNLKFGFQNHRYYTNQLGGGNMAEGVDRDSTQINPDVNPDNAGDHTGYAMASFLLGNVESGGGSQWSGPASLQTAWGAYGQDTFKVTNKVSVSAGVRWDFEPPRTERHNHEIFWDPNYTWDVSLNPAFNFQNDLKEAGVTGPAPDPYWMANGFKGRPAQMGSTEYPMRTLQHSYPTHFSPHFGVAYQLRPHTTVRGSYGMNWMSLIGSRFMNNATWNSGFANGIGIQNGTNNFGLSYYRTLENPTPNGAGYVVATQNSEQAAVNVALGQWYLAQAVNTHPGYEHNAQLSVQQQLGDGARAWILELNGSANLGRQLPQWLGKGEEIMQNAYNQIGSMGTALYDQVDNPVYGTVPTQYGAWADEGPTTALGEVYLNNPLFGQAWTMGQPNGTSNYFAMYIQAEHRFGNGFSLLTNYTRSKILQDVGSNDVTFNGQGQNYDTNGYPQAGLPVGTIYGVAPNDRANRFLVNYSLDLPVGRGKRFLGTPNDFGGAVLDNVVGGWTFAGTAKYWSGQPLSINASGSSFWANIGQGRASLEAVYLSPNYNNHVSGQKAIQGASGGEPYFKPSAFGFPQGAGIGNVPFTMPQLRGPGFSQWDMSMLKNFKLWSESSKLQFRAEAQNVFNHMDTSNPDENMSDSTFGYVQTGGAQANSPRVMMLAAKIIF